MHRRCRELACAFALTAGTSGLDAAPVFTRIARSGDDYPGRPGSVYSSTSTFVGARSIDSGGDIFFQAASQPIGDGATTTDLLVYRSATDVVEPYARTGDPVADVPAVMFWGAVGGHQAGVISHIAYLMDGTPGNASAVVVSNPDGSRFVAARQGQPAPGHAPPLAFTTVGLASGEFLDTNLNRTGVVSFGGRFRDANNTLRYGYYLTRPGGAAERIIDSTMPVPNDPAASWVAYDNIIAPFDIYTPGLDAAGNAYFRAKYRDGGVDRRAFYKRTADGGIAPIADAGSTDPVPGLPDRTYVHFRAAANNQAGDVAFAATLNGPGGVPAGTGVFAALGGGPLEKVIATGDPVPGIPEATTHQPGLIAMSDGGHLLVTENYFLEGLGGQSLLLFNPDGSAETVLRFNQTPGFPGGRAGLTTQADLNSNGDAVFITRMNAPSSTYVAFAFLHGTNELVPLMRTGEILEGNTVLSFDLGGGAVEVIGSIGASAGPVSWSDSGKLTLHVTVRTPSGTQAEALYLITVRPDANCPEDLNGDLAVNLADLAILLSHFGTPDGAARENGDTDGDGDVDLQDLASLLAHIGTACP